MDTSTCSYIRVYWRDSRANLLLLPVHSCSFVVRPSADLTIHSLRRSFPLEPHEHAREAALAAEAAGLQGRFWEMHDVLYREQAAWSKAPNARELFESYAGTIGLNLDQFRKDMDGEKARERVDSDHALGDSLGIKLTPTLYINNRPVDPKDKNPEGVRAAINAALAGKSQT